MRPRFPSFAIARIRSGHKRASVDRAASAISRSAGKRFQWRISDSNGGCMYLRPLLSHVKPLCQPAVRRSGTGRGLQSGTRCVQEWNFCPGGRRIQEDRASADAHESRGGGIECLERVLNCREVGDCGCLRRRAGRQPEGPQDFLGDFRKMNGGEHFHPSAASFTFQNVHQEYPFHQLGPGVIATAGGWR